MTDTGARRQVGVGDLGDIQCAGQPCIAYSLAGRQRKTEGPTAIVLLTWVALVCCALPDIVIFESVRQFPKDILVSLVGRPIFD